MHFFYYMHVYIHTHAHIYIHNMYAQTHCSGNLCLWLKHRLLSGNLEGVCLPSSSSSRTGFVWDWLVCVNLIRTIYSWWDVWSSPGVFDLVGFSSLFGGEEGGGGTTEKDFWPYRQRTVYHKNINYIFKMK